jgi:hypothetical protein
MRVEFVDLLDVFLDFMILGIRLMQQTHDDSCIFLFAVLQQSSG